MTTGFFRSQTEMVENRAAPGSTVGVVGWVRTNLLSSWLNAGLTILGLYIIWLIVPPLITWAFFDATFEGTDRFACENPGACWVFLDQRIGQFLYGFYPAEQTWRVNVALVLLIPAMAPLLFDKIPGAGYMRWFSLAYPFLATYLLIGGTPRDFGLEKIALKFGFADFAFMDFGLERVASNRFGGFMLNVTVGLSGIVLSLPFGVLLALGRRSQLPVVRIFCVGFIEVFRGVPLITMMFTAAMLLPLFLPPQFSMDLVVRVIIVVTAFASAYMAEVIRGGLAAIDRGQYEAAQALGLSYWKSMALIILPQALKYSIPGIVNTFIALFKDTTLVIVIGLFDILNIGRSMVANPDWLGLGIETYAIIALAFFTVCFSISRYSLGLERRLDTSR